jgi:pyrroloquinoline-quinone synthase
MHEGRLSPEEIRTWVRNRYYYQTRIPIKDGRILSKAEDPDFRRSWVERLHDHDGTPARTGGLELWLRLAEAVGLERNAVQRLDRVLPGVRAACDYYVAFVESHDLLAGVAASLTERRAAGLMAERIAAFEKHYPWVDPAGLAYFRSRTTQAARDGAFGLEFVLEHAQSPEDGARCVAALERKCAILWRLLDAVQAAGRRPRLAPHVMRRRDEESGRTLLVVPERAVRLNASGDEIVALCDGARTLEAIVTELGARHPGEAHLEEDVHAFVEDLERLGVLESAP